LALPNILAIFSDKQRGMLRRKKKRKEQASFLADPNKACPLFFALFFAHTDRKPHESR